MKKSAITAISLLLLAGASFAGPVAMKAPPARPIVPPLATSSGWYTGVNGGYLWLNDATACGCTNLNYDSGWGAHGVVGYHFGNGLSLGLSAGYLNADYSVADSDHGTSGSADLRMVPVTLNGTYSMDLTESVLVYVGGGLGTAWSELDGVDGGQKSGDWHFAWQGRAGFGFKVNNGLTLNLGYRYINVADALGDFGDAEGHMAEAGFKVKF